MWPDDVGWVCCWFSTLLWEVFLRVLWFSPLLKNQHFQIPIRSGMHGHFWTSSCELLGALWVNKLHLHLFYIFPTSDHLIPRCLPKHENTTKEKKYAHNLTLSSLPLRAVLLIVFPFQDWVVSDKNKDTVSYRYSSADSVRVPVHRCLFMAGAGRE